MKNVEEWFMIRELARQGLSITEIARRVGCDRKTVRKHLAHPEPPGHKARPPKLNKLDPFKSYLDQRLERGVFNCEVLYRELCEQGYDGKKKILRDYVQPYRLAARHQASVRFETPPGQQGQVDWGNFGTLWHQGRQRRLYCFVFTLGYSRAVVYGYATDNSRAGECGKIVSSHHCKAGCGHGTKRLISPAPTGCFGSPLSHWLLALYQPGIL